MYRIGVDVGGTNTDAVVMRGGEVVSAVKVPTSRDVTSGLMDALTRVRRAANVAAEDIQFVVIGTTHFTNAIVERRGLTPTAVVRLCLPAAQCVRPMADWPQDLRSVVGSHSYLASGGLEYDGRPIAPFRPEEITRIGQDIARKGLEAIAVCGVFSPINDAMEREVARQLAELCPRADISTSATIGGLGMLERESAAILNAALRALARKTVAALRGGLHECGLRCPMFISQNDGTLISAQRVEQFPVLTFASGPTNSMRGAAFLSGQSDAIVLDVGGTTTDAGLLRGGFPRQAATTVEIGGVRTNFRMPDVFSIGLGGGSIVHQDDAELRIGPHSVALDLERSARVFGGDVLTATDIGVACGRMSAGDPRRVADLDEKMVTEALCIIDRRLEAVVERTRISPEPIPVIVVGGGGVLVPDNLAGATVVRPRHYEVANAVGAAIAQVSGDVDRVFSLDTQTRLQALAAAEAEARRSAIQAGALAATITITEREDIPLAYLPGSTTGIRVKAIGEMGV